MLVTVVGVIAIIVTLCSLGAAGAAARFAPGAVTARVAGAGLFGGLLILIGAALQALFFWAAAQAIHVLLSIEGRGRESAALQRACAARLEVVIEREIGDALRSSGSCSQSYKPWCVHARSWPSKSAGAA